MKKFSFLLMASCIAIALSGCANICSNKTETHILSAKMQHDMSADDVINALKAGNERFIQHQQAERDLIAQLHESSIDGQHPMAIVLGCIDARVPVQYIFDMGVGDLFVTRIAGNVVSGDVLGSMEYACEHSGSKVVVILGHTQCGAVHSACEHVQAGNMTAMLSKILPAVEEAELAGKDLHDGAVQDEIARQNVFNMVELVRAQSEILSELEQEGEIKIVPALFHLDSGLVEWL